MVADVLYKFSRADRRRLVSNAERARGSGQWGSWERIPMPTGIPGATGWCLAIRAAYRNKVFSVLWRPCDTPQGIVTHLAISSLSHRRPTWPEAQRIKNELIGEDRIAVEVYPRQVDVVDGADMYHLWALPPDHTLAFGLHGEPA